MDTRFFYTTYIQSTPERLWQALTDPADTRRYLACLQCSGVQAGGEADRPA